MRIENKLAKNNARYLTDVPAQRQDSAPVEHMNVESYHDNTRPKQRGEHVRPQVARPGSALKEMFEPAALRGRSKGGAATRVHSRAKDPRPALRNRDSGACSRTERSDRNSLQTLPLTRDGLFKLLQSFTRREVTTRSLLRAGFGWFDAELRSKVSFIAISDES